MSSARGSATPSRRGRSTSRKGNLRCEVGRVAGAEHVPRQRVGANGMQRFAEHYNRAFTIGRDEHEVARVRLVAPRRMDARSGRFYASAHLGGRLIVAERREQMHL